MNFQHAIAETIVASDKVLADMRAKLFDLFVERYTCEWLLSLSDLEGNKRRVRDHADLIELTQTQIDRAVVDVTQRYGSAVAKQARRELSVKARSHVEKIEAI